MKLRSKYRIYIEYVFIRSYTHSTQRVRKGKEKQPDVRTSTQTKYLLV